MGANNSLTFGGRLVIQGCFFGCICLTLFLYWITSSLNYSISVQAADADNSQGVNKLEKKPEESNGRVSDKDAGNDQGEQISENCAVSHRFPARILQWCSWITTYAQKNDLPPDLVAAVIWQESGGSPQAYSHSGAVGLMQIMPKNGLAASFMCANGPCFASRPTVEKLKDPEFNISYGTRMLGGLVRRHGNYREALKYYGPMDMGYYYADKIMGIYKRYGD